MWPLSVPQVDVLRSVLTCLSACVTSQVAQKRDWNALTWDVCENTWSRVWATTLRSVKRDDELSVLF